MSIDLGSEFIKLGLVKPGVPMEIVLNAESRRKTPNLLGIRNGERFFADAAAALTMKQPQNTFPFLLSLLAKHTNHSDVELYKSRFPFNSLIVGNAKTGAPVEFADGESKYNIETLLAMILWNARKTTEAYAGDTVKDAVITVPAFYTQAERRAIATAAQIAGLNLLQLLSDGTAAALHYGVFRRKEIKETRQTLLIFDMGSSKTAASLVEFVLEKDKKTQVKTPTLRTLGIGFDRHLGGFDFTLRLRDHLVKEFRAKHKTKTDVTSNARAMAKLLKEAERVKQVLSANVDHFAQIESLHEDIDFRVKVTRQVLEELCEDLFSRIEKPVKDAIAMAELNLDQVDHVVLMGAGTRVPKVQAVLQNAVGGKELGKFLNTDEAIALGALFQAAHLSKGFKVKPFNVHELLLYPIQVNFESKAASADGEARSKETRPIARTLFSYKSSFPTARKVISLTSYIDDFAFHLNYGELSHLDDAHIKEMGVLNVSRVEVSGLTKALEEQLKGDEREFKGVKAAFRLDESAIIHLDDVHAVIERKAKGAFESITSTLSGFFKKEKEEGEPTEENGDVPEKKESTEEKKDEDAKEGDESKKEESAAASEKRDEDTEKEKKTEEADKGTETDEKTDKATTTEIPKKNETAPKEEAKTTKAKLRGRLVHLDWAGLSKNQTEEARKILAKFEKEEAARHERAAAENELEALAIDLSSRLDDDVFAKFSTETERQKVAEEVQRVRTWLEDEVGPHTKTLELTRNFVTLRDLVKPVFMRINESKTIDEAIQGLESLMNSSAVFVDMSRVKGSDLFKADDIKRLETQLNKTKDWLGVKLKEQQGREPHEDPVLLTADVLRRTKAIDREVKTLLKNMKQYDPLKEAKKKPKEEKKDDEAAKSAEADSTIVEEEVAPGEKSADVEKDVDSEKIDTPETPKQEL